MSRGGIKKKGAMAALEIEREPDVTILRAGPYVVIYTVWRRSANYVTALENGQCEIASTL